MDREKGTYDVVDWPFLRPLLRNRWLSWPIPWTFQSLLYMDRTDRLVKVGLDVAGTALGWLVLRWVVGDVLAAIVALLVAHTVNWLLNGSPFVYFRYFWNVRCDQADVLAVLDRMRDEGRRQPSLLGAFAFGSAARGELQKGSDLDIVLLRRPGLTNGLRAACFAARQRTRAAMRAFPLDLYVADSPAFWEKMNESAVVLFDYRGGEGD